MVLLKPFSLNFCLNYSCCLDWLIEGSVQKLILVIKGVESKDTLERWAFDCEMPKENRDVSGYLFFVRDHIFTY